jgi:hypothetical protein
MICCLCHAVDELREGHLRDGPGLPLCASHRAKFRCKPRSAVTEQKIVWPAPPDQQLAIQAALCRCREVK